MNFQIPDTIPRAALVTGGEQPAGRAIAAALAKAGFAVALQARRGVDFPGLVLTADLTDETEVAALPARAAAAIGPLGLLVNAARVVPGDIRTPSPGDAPRGIQGDIHGDTCWTETTAGWNAHMAIHLRAPFLLIQQFAKRLPAGREGVAINLLDRDIHALAPARVSYSLSMAGLWNLTQTLALALAPNIRVNGISGGEPGELARAAIAILAFRSMTGQMIRSDGMPPPDA